MHIQIFFQIKTRFTFVTFEWFLPFMNFEGKTYLLFFLRFLSFILSESDMVSESESFMKYFLGLCKVNSISLPKFSPSNYPSLSLESSESESKFRALEISSVDNFLFGYLSATF